MMQLIQTLMQNPALIQSAVPQRTAEQRTLSAGSDAPAFSSALENAKTEAANRSDQKTKSSENGSVNDAIEQIEPVDELDESQAALYFILPQNIPTFQAVDVPADDSDQLAGLLENLPVTDAVISILEGNPSNTDIEPLLDDDTNTETLGFQLSIDSDADETARTPLQPSELPPDIDAAVVRDKIHDNGGPGPLENENDSLDSPKTTQDSATVRAPDREEKPDENHDSTTYAQPQLIDLAPERVEASQQLDAESFAPAVSTTDELFDNLVERIELSQANDLNQMEIHLKPDFLGKVTINLSMSDTGLTAKISADDPSVRNLIGGQINSLIETLDSRGIKVENVEVVYTGVSDQNANQQNSGQNQPQNSGRSGSVSGIDDSSYAPFPGSDPVDTLDSDLSSVEYRA